MAKLQQRLDDLPADAHRAARELVGNHGADAFVVAALWMSCTIDAGDTPRAKALETVVETINDMHVERLGGNIIPIC